MEVVLCISSAVQWYIFSKLQVYTSMIENCLCKYHRFI